MELYMIRHAPVVSHKNEIYGDNALIDLALVEDKIYALAKNLTCNIEQTYWYHSGVSRAQKTAQAVLTQKLEKNHDILIANKGFREQDFGSVIGVEHKKLNEKDLKFIDGKIFSSNPPNGESLIDFIGRVESAIQQVKIKALQEHKNNIVVFCNGGTIRAADMVINRKSLKDFIKLETQPLQLFRYNIADIP